MMFRRLSIGAVAAVATAFVVAPAAVAAPAPVFNNYGDCQQAGINEVTKAGGPASGVSFYCEKTYTVPGGVAGCPATSADGCLGEYYVLHTRNV
ncbi:hypothetical protein EV383_5956 [Pseudonocardia sediminis]|uniref:Uncharacterized protein n=2 Tax=Pseudonocardia sediminis TaxID=1397368 RepID=A0A4Q7V342_PSEST|nr:hypothetical protein EV383_5956 [Pseudonocardia sediminis]